MRPRFFTATTIFALAWLGCEWASEPSRVEREPTWGVELVLNVEGPGNVDSIEPGIRCPGTCYARIVSNVAADAAPRAITLRAKPVPGYRLARWTADPSRIAGHGPGPAECNPIRRAALTPDLGDAAEVTLPFGDVDGIPPPGMSEKCANYSRVPVAYNLTAVFEREGVLATDVWARLASGFATLLMVTDTAVYVRQETGRGTFDLVRVSLGDPSFPFYVAREAAASGPFDMTHHVVWLAANELAVLPRDASSIRRFAASGSPCEDLTSTAAHIYCRTRDGGLFRWTVDGSSLSLVHSALPAGRGMTATATHVYMVADDADRTSSIVRLAIQAEVDGGTPPLQVIAKQLDAPRNLRADAEYVYAVVGTSSESVVRFAVNGGTPTTFTVGGFQLSYAPDPPGGDPLLWAGSSTDGSVWQIASYLRTPTTQATTPRRRVPQPVRGIAVTPKFFYWTQNDDKVYRGLR